MLLVCGGLLLAVVTFTAVTLVLGQPFYESLAERVERMEGGAPDAPRRSPAQQFGSAIRDGLASVLLAAGFGVLLFVAGFLPLVGQTVVPAIGVCVSGFFLTEQLAGVALDRRGLTFRQRVRLLRARLWLALGFGRRWRCCSWCPSWPSWRCRVGSRAARCSPANWCRPPRRRDRESRDRDSGDRDSGDRTTPTNRRKSVRRHIVRRMTSNAAA
ncbi:EI24 domain-containing protein [Streptacidiphilus monticola]